MQFLAKSIAFGIRNYVVTDRQDLIGEVVSGMEAVDKIKKGEPVQNPDRIVKMQVAADAK